MTSVAITRRRVTLLGVFLLCFAGYRSYLTSPRDEDPGFLIRVATISAQFPGAPAEKMELQVAKKIEEVAKQLAEVEKVTSISQRGYCRVTVTLYDGIYGLQPIWDRLRRKVDGIRGDLPEGVQSVQVDDEFADIFGILYGLSGDGYSPSELREIAEEVRDEFLLIPEAAKVVIQGVQQERIYLEYAPARLAELGLSPSSLAAVLKGRNVLLSGGSIRVRDERLEIAPTGALGGLEELAGVSVPLPSGEVVRLDQIVALRRGYADPPRSLVGYGGDAALLLAISMKDGGNIIELGEQARATARRMEASQPLGVELREAYFQPELVSKKINEFVGNLLQSVALVIVFMVIPLGLRTGLVVASLIPFAVLAALAVMGQLGIGLDQMSLAALIIALGMLVDNAVVVSESIMVMMAEGRDAAEAAAASAVELQIPLLTSSLTTAAAFLPIYLAESSVGEYTAPIFKVVTITLLSSWVLSLTIIPLLCILFLKVEKAEGADAFGGLTYRTYRGTLSLFLRHRLLGGVFVVGVFYGAMQLFAYVPAIFFPDSDRPYFSAEVTFPPGTAMEVTADRTAEIDAFLGKQDGIAYWTSYVGTSPPRYALSANPGTPSANVANFLIKAKNHRQIDGMVKRIDRFLLETFPGVEPKVKKMSSGPSVDAPIEIRLDGRDAGRLLEIADDVRARVAQLPGIKNVRNDWGSRVRQIRVNIDGTRAQSVKVSSRDVATSLEHLFGGRRAGELREGDDLRPVFVRAARPPRNPNQPIEGMPMDVYSSTTQQAVHISQVAAPEIDWITPKVLRYNGLYRVKVLADLEPGYTAAATNKLLLPGLKEAAKSWRGGATLSLGGDAEESGKANQSIVEKLGIAFGVIVLLLVVQFDSIRRPLIILATIPLGLIGVVLGLLATGQPMGFMTFLGIISLSGIVINNAIVLIERIDLEINVNGLAPDVALIEAGQRRLRPILLTTSTTVGGLIPLYMGGGAMWEPMAAAIIGGLLVSTMLTLVVVPLLYSILFRVTQQPGASAPSQSAAKDLPASSEAGEPRPEKKPVQDKNPSQGKKSSKGKGSKGKRSK